ncbi:hypothetical protein [Shewanella gelidii]|uniref:Uncharacterized protein n=1 Tax=Shewanella gelidii TaxID=1642821 RepID=A0A917JYT9_9GAMM|nr:hypothetical protein [Shewanella gelidii]MCL1099685.1 hypothetical protein [Shewanella gelidii]GGI93325.1 hypothetical protein GCM10009332_33240 [Shewanella gelidii]
MPRFVSIAIPTMLLVGVTLITLPTTVWGANKSKVQQPKHLSKHYSKNRHWHDPWRWRDPYWRYGWNRHWYGGWGSYYWNRPYSGIGISIPLNSVSRERKQPVPSQSTQRTTTHVAIQSGLKRLPANARVKQVNGGTVYEWQGREYKFDWQSQTYQLQEKD